MATRTALSGVAACCQAAAVAARLARPTSSITSTTSRSPLVPLFAALTIQTRDASILASLRDNKGAHQKRIRVGRGPSSGKGKTSGRGHKGQGQHGKVKPWFQGGQTPLIRTWGKKGFVNHRADVMSEVNLDRLQAFIDAGRIDATKPITPRELIESGLVGKVRDGIKILARGKEDLRTPVDLLVSRASAGAIDAIEAVGGKIVTRYFTKQSIKWLLEGKSVISSTPMATGPEHVEAAVAKLRAAPHLRRLPDPTSRWDIEYYRDPAHRGYLSDQLKPGESPSLYFKVPGVQRIVRPGGKVIIQKKEEDVLF
ncbi:large subunit ribosomal protein L15 [Sporothrix schenckii 1099-18]|uniref:Ribosomal protein L15 n=2 Tax=Sporothrix schenckii TaxID=29908 RepID=U7PP72_SPOS1|nr:large subunit ribosomal protein L15 [Sporothrix schenckii 1099-18]ERS97413.1 ribosomal protein L15 [Sporothrix schenckii ATCC 58251]KJR81907.1 large subunit ribosomal protein L15 [Sporothrix schenckii 1099-18]